MRDKTHEESVDRWAEYVLTHKDWKRIHTRFINAQFEKARQAMERILRQPDGKKVIKEIYGIKNDKGYPSLFLK